MLTNCKSFLYLFDLIGPFPQLLIFNNNRYKSFFSSISSILIVIISLTFGIYSLIDFLKYKNPIIVYSKANDEETERKILLENTPLMFQLVDTTTLEAIDSSIAYYEGDYYIIYDNGTLYGAPLIIENCELGKNIDLKNKDIITDKYKFGRKIEDFYCISFKNENLSLFYHPNIGFSGINIYIIIKNNSINIPGKIQSLIVSESDIIDHNNKNNPINKNYIYQFTTAFNSLEYTNINFNFQYVKYESDDGLLFQSSKILNGTSFSDMYYYRYIQDNYNLKENLKNNNSSRIGVISFSINKSNFDNYKRNYSRLQSLLAEVMSVVSLLFEIGRQISNLLCNKKMSNDIINHLINKDKNLILFKNNNNIDKLFKVYEKNDLSSSERKKIDSQMIDKMNNKNNLEINNEINLNKSKDNNKIHKNGEISQINTIKKI